jgi:uncharacterized protein YjiS (DUF1127 family)
MATDRPSVVLAVGDFGNRFAQYLFSTVVGTGHVLVTWYHRARQRKALLELADWQLHDVGLTREQVRMEAARPFWQN